MSRMSIRTRRLVSAAVGAVAVAVMALASCQDTQRKPVAPEQGESVLK